MRGNFFFLLVCLCLTMHIFGAEEEQSIWVGAKYLLMKGVKHFKATGRGEKALEECEKKDKTIAEKDAEIKKLPDSNGNNGGVAKLSEEFKGVLAAKDVEIEALKQQRIKDTLSGFSVGVAAAGAGYQIYHLILTRYYPTPEELDLQEKIKAEEMEKNTFWENRTKLRACLRINARIENGKTEMPFECKELSALFSQQVLDEMMQLYNRKH